MTDGKPDNILRLKDGRLLGYAEYGDPEGKPGFFFHGIPGSRMEAQLGHAAAASLGIRMIAIDRPGYGLSDFKPGRTILDWPDDVVELAGALTIQRFAVAGLSGGGPYAAVCAFKIPERLTAAAIISGSGPFDAPDAREGMTRENRIMFGMARRFPWLMNVPYWLLSRGSPDRIVSRITSFLREPDSSVVARPEVRAVLRDDEREAFRSGSRGAAWESVLLARPWGFRLEDITMQVHLWQGERDLNVPPAMGRYQAQAIPNCRATFYPDDGHFSLVVDRMEEIVGTLAAQE